MHTILICGTFFVVLLCIQEHTNTIRKQRSSKATAVSCGLTDGFSFGKCREVTFLFHLFVSAEEYDYKEKSVGLLDVLIRKYMDF